MCKEGKRIDKEVEDEREHFIQCKECGGWIDMRDLSQVLLHEQSGHEKMHTVQ